MPGLTGRSESALILFAAPGLESQCAPIKMKARIAIALVAVLGIGLTAWRIGRSPEAIQTPPQASEDGGRANSRNERSKDDTTRLRAEIQLVMESGLNAESFKELIDRKDFLPRLLKLKPEELLALLEACGISKDGDTERYYYGFCGVYIVEKSLIDPKMIVQWLKECGDKKLVQSSIPTLSTTEPEELLALILGHFELRTEAGIESEGFSRTESLFITLGDKDPLRAATMIKGLEDEELRKAALKSVIHGWYPDNFPLENWEIFFAMFSAEELEGYRNELRTLGNALGGYRIDMVEDRFPLDSNSWRRSVAVESLVSRADTWPQEAIAYVGSEKGAPLTAEEKERILAKAQKTIERRERAAANKK